jgi:adenosylmethionine-8-amino-7-oxononanoate aminotransferase
VLYVMPPLAISLEELDALMATLGAAIDVVTTNVERSASRRG